MPQTFGQSITEPGSFLDPGHPTEPMTVPTGEIKKPEVLPHALSNQPDTVPMWDPDRKAIVDVPRNHAEHLVATGYTFPDGSKPIVGEEDVQKEKYANSALGGVELAGHNFINSSLFGAPEAAFNFLAPTDTVKAYRERNERLDENHPIAGVAGNLAGFLNPGTGGLIAHGFERAGAKLTGSALAKLAATGAEGKLASAAAFGIKHAGKIGSTSVGLGADAALRGAVGEASNEKSWDHPLDVERVFAAGANDFGWGVATGAAFEGAFGALRVGRTGISKAADFLETKYPTKLKRIGTEDTGELVVKKVKDKTVIVSKELIETKLKPKSARKPRAPNAKPSEEPGVAPAGTPPEPSAAAPAPAESEMETRTKTTDYSGNYEQPQEPKGDAGSSSERTVSLPEDDVQLRPTRFVWSPGRSLEENMATWRQSFEDLAEDDPEKTKLLKKYANLELQGQLSLEDHTWNDPDTGKEQFIPASPAHAQLIFAEKHALGEQLHEIFPSTDTAAGFQEHLNEYFNLSKKRARVLSHEQLTEMAKDIKPGVHTTVDNREGSTTTSSTGTEAPAAPMVEPPAEPSEPVPEDTTAKTKSKKAAGKQPPGPPPPPQVTIKGSRTTNTYGTIREHTLGPAKKAIYKNMFIPGIGEGKREHLMIAAGILGYATGGVLGTVAASTGFALDSAVAGALNNRAAVSAGLNKLTKPPIKAAAGTLKAYLRSRGSDDRTDHNPVDVKHYAKAIDNTQKLSNQEVAAKHVQDAMEPIAHHFPTLQAQLIQKNIQAAQLLQPFVPRDTRAPALRNTPFEPSRSQKVKFLKMYDSITKPLEVMRNPSPAQMQVIEKHVPAHVDLFRQAISGALIQSPKKVADRKQTQLSVAMGSALTPRQDSKYMQRLQMTAHIDETQKPPAPSPSGGKGGKVTQQAVTLDAPPNILNQIS